jgi:hypothetical protein
MNNVAHRRHKNPAQKPLSISIVGFEVPTTVGHSLHYWLSAVTSLDSDSLPLFQYDVISPTFPPWWHRATCFYSRVYSYVQTGTQPLIVMSGWRWITCTNKTSWGMPQPRPGRALSHPRSLGWGLHVWPGTWLITEWGSWFVYSCSMWMRSDLQSYNPVCRLRLVRIERLGGKLLSGLDAASLGCHQQEVFTCRQGSDGCRNAVLPIPTWQ